MSNDKEILLTITPAKLPFDENDKIFYYDEESEFFSYNDFLETIKSMAGVSEDLKNIP
jgi:hypothetical protein